MLSEPLTSPAKKLILIIDDDENIRDILDLIISESGKFKTATANGGAEGLVAIRKLHPSFVLLDVQMPGISGFDVLRELKTIPDPPLVLIVSGYEDKAVLNQAYLLGARDVLEKPFTAVNVMKKIEGLLFMETEAIGKIQKPAVSTATPAPTVVAPAAYLKTHRAKLSDILVSIALISEEQRQALVKRCRPNESDLGEIIIAEGLVSEEKYLKVLSLRLNLSYFTSLEGLLKKELGRLLPENFARKHLVAAAFLDKEEFLNVAALNPLDVTCFDEIELLTGKRVKPFLVTRACLFAAIQAIYRDDAGPRPDAATGESSSRPRQESEARSAASSSSPAPSSAGGDDAAVELVTFLLQEGLRRHASDIHVEPNDKNVLVRYRVDGMLQEGSVYPKDVLSSLVARVKILAKLDITETRLPQDGHLRFEHVDAAVDLRVSVMPTVNGEKIALRILDSSGGAHALDELGIEPPVLESLKAAIHSPNGLLLVTGPTGSGKTTTLYAIIADLNDLTRNITTLEDPVEYRMRYVNQIEMHAKIGLTFASALRSVLRQDPNIILVGEIRDRETAEISIQASITGHMVFSTLHTNDTISSIHRLINMDIPPFMICASLRGVLAQRLVRRLCPACRQESAPASVEPSLAAYCRPGERFAFPVGCAACSQSGYHGRLAIREWLPFGKTMRELVFRKASTDEMRSAARAEGMKTLLESGLELARRGETSLDEVLRVSREGE
jgi:type IV pilus assembly protein PilB